MRNITAGNKGRESSFPQVNVFVRSSQHFFSHVGTEPTLTGYNQYCRDLMCLAQGHNTATPVGIEPRTSRFGVRRSTTKPPLLIFDQTNSSDICKLYTVFFKLHKDKRVILLSESKFKTVVSSLQSGAIQPITVKGGPLLRYSTIFKLQLKT